MADLLLGLSHLIVNSNFQLSANTNATQQIQTGELFETYCKDWLALLPPGDIQNRQTAYEKEFAYQGNPNNPPDVMYRGGDLGDAFEFKKSENPASAIPLNSSYPKNQLLSINRNINSHCRDCEIWANRTLYYIVGVIPPRSQRVKSLWVVDGKVMAANHQYYENIFSGVKSSINSYVEQYGIESVPSVELARLKNFDPLKRTVMRSRSMWELEGPHISFGNAFNIMEPTGPVTSILHAIITEEKWESYSASSQKTLLELEGTSGLSIKHNVEVPDPNSSQNKIKVKLIRFAR
jgi:NgoPII restriction endonuclease